MRLMIALLLGTTALVACGQQGAPKNETAAEAVIAPSAEEMAAETARLNEWFDAKYEEQLDFSPISRTFLGDKKDYDKIDDLSEEAQTEQLEWQRQTVEDLKKNLKH